MTKFTAGQFELDISPPSPRWICISTYIPNGMRIEVRFHPDALPDLAHVVTRALKETGQL